MTNTCPCCNHELVREFENNGTNENPVIEETGKLICSNCPSEEEYDSEN